MKILIALLSLALSLVTTAQAAPTLPSQIEAVNLMSGKKEAIHFPKNKGHHTVVAFLSARCPCSGSHEEILKKLAADYSAKGFDFIAIHSNQDEPLKESEEHFKGVGLNFPVLHDDGAKIANDLQAFKTPHTFVFSPSGEMLYQGGVDDSNDGPKAKKHYLAETLEAIRQGKPVPQKETRTLGCFINRKKM